MTLFGDLEHHALTDLARVLGPRSGTLFFHSAYRGRTLELTVVQGHLRALYLDGFPVREPGRVRDILGELRAQGRGAFEFKPRDSATAASFHDLPLTEVFPVLTEASIPEDQLPHADTRFVPTLTSSPVPPSLVGAWALVRPHLASGASASDLARRVGRPEREIQATLFRLRAVDLIAPQRAGNVSPRAAGVAGPVTGGATPGQGSVSPTPPAPAPLVQRLLGALRRLSGVASA